jgi:Phosphotransferase system, mannose/fructose/N-acetylgalactosamine-specific component IID
MTDIQHNTVTSYDDSKSEQKMFRQLFFRQFQLLGSMNFTRMEGLSYGWILAPLLKRIYAGNPHGYLESLKEK